jgi:hypothetical protein
MRRLFWFALGAALGAWAMHKVTRITRSFTPRGVTARAFGVGARLRSYAADIRAEMTAREAELWSAMRADAVRDGASAKPALVRVPEPRGRHVRTTERTPNGKVFDDDKDGH